jgi:hypothetical protein
MKRWNVRARTYGRPWAAGDVIGCCIDLSAGEQPPPPGGAQGGAGGSSGGGDAAAEAGSSGGGAEAPAAPAPPAAPPGPAPVGTITFYRNGVSLGTAFANVRMLQHGAAYFPGLSLSQGERCDVNFGQTPFVHPVAGFAPLQAPPPPAAEGYLRAVTCALARLLLLRLRRCAAGGAGAGCGGWGGGPGVSAEEAAAVEGRLRAFLSDASAADAADAAAAAGAAAANARHAAPSKLQPRQPEREGGVPVWPGDDAFALLAGLVGEHLTWLVDHSEWWLHAYALPLVLHVHGLEPPHAGGAARALMQLCQLALPADAFARLVSALGRVLGHYASMAPFQRPGEPAGAAGADGAAGAAPGAAAGTDADAEAPTQQQQVEGSSGGGATDATGAKLGPWGARPARGVFEATGFSQIRQLAYTGAYPFTSALASLVALPDAAAAWAGGRQWLGQMEAVLSRKLPTLDDLKDLMPHVPRFAAGGSGGGSAAGGSGAAGHHRVRMLGGDAFRSDVRQLTAAMRGIEANQMALAAAAAAAPPPPQGSGLPAPDGGAPPLLRLVRHVLRRNRYITSSSPPPGLSDGTVLTSLFYLLLRMLQPYVAGARPSYSLRHFPAGRLFVHSVAAAPPGPPQPAGGVGPLGPRGGGGGAAAAAARAQDGVGEVLSDLIRVGGLVSHLQREARVSDDALGRHGGGRIDVPEWAPPPVPPRRARPGVPPASAAAAAATSASLSSASPATSMGGSIDGEEGGAPVLADEWLPELLSAALVLYTWRVSGSVQSGTAMAGVMEANIGGMQVGGGGWGGAGGAAWGRESAARPSGLGRRRQQLPLSAGLQAPQASNSRLPPIEPAPPQELSELERMLEQVGGAGSQGGAGPMAAARTTVQSEVESSTRCGPEGWHSGTALCVWASTSAATGLRLNA